MSTHVHVRSNPWRKLLIRIKRIKAYVYELAHNRITLIFIPHTEDNVVRIRLSPFLIYFFISLFMILLIVFSISLTISSSSEDKKTKLLNSLSKEQQIINSFVQNFSTISREIEHVGPILSKSQELILDYRSNLRDSLLLGNQDLREQVNLNYATLSPLFARQDDKSVNELENMLNLARRLEILLYNIHSMHQFIKTREEVLFDLPSSWPVTGGLITSLYGERFNPFDGERSVHTGIDIANTIGTPIRAAAPGEVVASTFSGQFGNMVKIEHKYGYATIYGHNQKNLVSVGDKVRRGDIIAEVGQTGYATGPHCHYGVQIGDEIVNPYLYLMIR